MSSPNEADGQLEDCAAEVCAVDSFAAKQQNTCLSINLICILPITLYASSLWLKAVNHGYMPSYR
jgi:hypothetical protein